MLFFVDTIQVPGNKCSAECWHRQNNNGCVDCRLLIGAELTSVESVDTSQLSSPTMHYVCLWLCAVLSVWTLYCIIVWHKAIWFWTDWLIWWFQSRGRRGSSFAIYIPQMFLQNIKLFCAFLACLSSLTSHLKLSYISLTNCILLFTLKQVEAWSKQTKQNKNMVKEK